MEEEWFYSTTCINPLFVNHWALPDYPQFNPDTPVVPKKPAGGVQGSKGEVKANDHHRRVEKNNNLEHLKTRETNWLGSDELVSL